jgi:hypothetical protein
MFNYRTIENWFLAFDISDAEADRISANAATYEEFVAIWENEDWWADVNNA